MSSRKGMNTWSGSANQRNQRPTFGDHPTRSTHHVASVAIALTNATCTAIAVTDP
jgi:hypothetical protein